MDEKNTNNQNGYENASSGSMLSSPANLTNTESTYASAESSPQGIVAKDELDSQRLTISETILKEHKEKMQKIAIGIREYAFGKEKQNDTVTADSPDADRKDAASSNGSQQFSFSLIDKMLARNGESTAKTASPHSQAASDSHARVHEHATNVVDSPMHSNNSTLSAASSSSPNPDFSPFKLLSNEVQSNSSTSNNHIIHSLASAMANAGIGTQPSATSTSHATDRVLIANSIVENNPLVSKPTIDTLNSDKIIETLTSLSHKDHEKADPILSAAKNSSTSPSSLPASSREFCMNLNLNLAVAAAATASGPVAIVDNTKSASFDGLPTLHQQYLEHSKFTSNASTSSIHNDLKMILEESLNKNQVNYGAQTLGDKRNEMPKPQRVHQGLQGEKQSMVPSQKQVTKIVLTTPAPPDLHATKSSNIDLSKYMQMLIESKNKSMSSSNNGSPKKPMSYRYSREFLYQIRDQRAEFIQQIYPDIFQAYCYCSNGDYWDPEKYFDIIQFPSEIERMQNLQQKQQMYSKTNFKNYQQKLNAKNAVVNNNKNLYQQKLFGNSVNSPCAESPQPLQVPKNSPRMHMDSENEKIKASKQKVNNKTKMSKPSKKISTSVLTSLGLAEEMKISSDEIDESTLLGYSNGHMISSMMSSNNSDADKILLSLLKSSETAKKVSKQERTMTNTAGGKVDLLDMLNKPKNKPMTETSVQKPTESVDLVKNMFHKESTKTAHQTKPSGPRHFPQIFSVQELEMDQITKMKQQASKLPTSAQQLETGSDLHKHHKSGSHHHQESHASGSDSAYKKLLLNLNNESKQPSQASHLNNLFTKLESKSSQKNTANGPQPAAANEGTKLLKQLLNLKPTTDSPTDSAKEKKSKKNHRHQNKKSTEKKDNSQNVSKSSEPQQPQKTSGQDVFQHHAVDKHAMNKKTIDSNAHIENLLNKINESKHREHKKYDQVKQQREQKDHFNSLLNKIQAPQTTSQSQTSSVQPAQMTMNDQSTDILKWFTKANASSSNKVQSIEKTMPGNWTSLSEIELMTKQRPLVGFGQTH